MNQRLRIRRRTLVKQEPNNQSGYSTCQQGAAFVELYHQALGMGLGYEQAGQILRIGQRSRGNRRSDQSSYHSCCKLDQRNVSLMSARNFGPTGSGVNIRQFQGQISQPSIAYNQIPLFDGQALAQAQSMFGSAAYHFMPNSPGYHLGPNHSFTTMHPAQGCFFLPRGDPGGYSCSNDLPQQSCSTSVYAECFNAQQMPSSETGTEPCRDSR